MKNKANVISIVLFLSVFIMLVSYGNQKVEWKGTIEKENGVKVIKNPREPLYGEIKFELEEDLSIGREDDENYLFYRAIYIAVDKQRNIYILDSGNSRIQKFDRDGNYLQTIGRKGQGPGEFDMPREIQINDETGELFVNDKLRIIKRFNQKGEYLDEDIHVRENLLVFFVDKDSSIWGKFDFPGYHSLKKVNPDGKTEKKITEISFKMGRKKSYQKTVGRTTYVGGHFFTHGYEHDLFISKINNQTFIYGYSNDYELSIIDLDGNTLLKIRKSEPYKKFAAGDKDRIKYRISTEYAKKGRPIGDFDIDLPEHKPFFYSIKTDNKDRIYVRTNPVSRESNTNHEYDVFNKEGLYLYKMHLNYYPNVIKNGYVYTRIANEETGLEQIKRYRIKNWDKIKEGIS